MSQADAPLITTIIPTYRRPQLLRRAIRSVLRQTYPHLVVAVLDNASGDETEEVVAELAREDPRVRYHRHPENIGASANFIYGMERVETPFFSFLSDDDVLLPPFYELALESLEEHPQAIFAAGTVIEMNSAGRVLGTNIESWSRHGYFAPPEGMYTMIDSKFLPFLPGMLFRRELLAEFGLFDPTIIAADVDLTLRVAARFPFVTQKRPFAIFTRHAASWSTSNPVLGLTEEWPKVLRNIEGDQRIPPEVRARSVEAQRQYLQEQIYRIGMQRAIARDARTAHQAAAALREQYGLTQRSRRLDRVATLCRWAAPLAWSASLALYIRQSRHHRRNRGFQKRFGAYAKYLALG